MRTGWGAGRRETPKFQGEVPGRILRPWLIIGERTGFRGNYYELGFKECVAPMGQLDLYQAGENTGWGFRR